MASGADLLLQLQSRTKQRVESPPAAIAAPESVRKEIAATAPLESSRWTNAQVPQKPNAKSPRSVNIIVCTGSNCGSSRVQNTLGDNPGGHGCGVSATLLEIEELVQEFRYATADSDQDSDDSVSGAATKIHVTSGGCVGHCSMGPTVSVVTDSSNAYPLLIPPNSPNPPNPHNHTKTAKSSTNIQYFHRVNTVPACTLLVQEVTASYTNGSAFKPPNDSANKGHGGLLGRRAEGMLWKALKEISRQVVRPSDAKSGRAGSTKTTKTTSTSAEVLLIQAIQAEVVAAGSDPEKVDRAHRKQRRLETVLQSKTSNTSATTAADSLLATSVLL